MQTWPLGGSMIHKHIVLEGCAYFVPFSTFFPQIQTLQTWSSLSLEIHGMFSYFFQLNKTWIHNFDQSPGPANQQPRPSGRRLVRALPGSGARPGAQRPGKVCLEPVHFCSASWEISTTTLKMVKVELSTCWTIFGRLVCLFRTCSFCSDLGWLD